MIKLQNFKWLIILCSITLVIISACGQVQSDTPLPIETLMDVTITPSNTPQPVPVESIMVWDVGSTSKQTIYDQAQREDIAREPYFFWPDGSIAFIPVGDQYRFFAPNGARTTRMLGTFDDPGAKLEASKITIQGVDPQFSFASSGSIYQDPDSGMLLMFYHAERYLGGDPSNFHAALGLAISNDQGESFQNLGIILETNAQPNSESPCCADMGGAPFVIKDGKFYVYFRDRMANLDDIQLALAIAPVEDVLTAARNGTTSEWTKYYNGSAEPGIFGRSSPLEDGNPYASWFSVSYNSYLKKFIMAISSHSWTDLYDGGLYLISSDDGIVWTPRVRIDHCSCELTYPTIISPDGDPRTTDEEFYVYYVTTRRGVRRFEDTEVQRMTVTLTSHMVEIPRAWEFEKDTDREGWAAANQIGTFGVNNGAMLIEAIGNDPFINSPELGFSSTTYTKIEIHMKSGAAGTGQIFFTNTDASGISEASSVRFPVEVSEDFRTYLVDMSHAYGWIGRIKMLRIDPIDQVTHVEIDYIRLLP